jgi:NhaP-type Na+/H+ or K+/H+ antiporter
MILFTISLELCRGGTMGLIDIIKLFFELTVGAIVLGVIFGVIATELIKLFKNDSFLCYNTTLVGCYLVYYVAEYGDLGIHISGIMALVSMGLYMAAFCRTKFTTEAREKVHRIWKVYVFVAETIIFILGGVIVGTKSLNNPNLIDLIGYKEIACLVALYFCMMFARFISISLFMPKLRQLGYGLKWIEVVALTYGGLRGAVGIAFTLILASFSFLPAKFRSISIFNMAGCAFLTLMINAPTCNWVIRKLGLCNKSETKVKLFNKFVKICKK